jgi:hypothetical protein
MNNTKVKMLLLMLNAEAVKDVKEKLDIAYNEECVNFSKHVLSVGKDNVPEPVRLKYIAELQELVKELGAL